MSDQTVYLDTGLGFYESESFPSNDGKTLYYRAKIEDSPEGGYRLQVELYEEGNLSPKDSWQTDDVKTVDEAVQGLGDFAKNWNLHQAPVQEHIFEATETEVIAGKTPSQRSTLPTPDKQQPSEKQTPTQETLQPNSDPEQRLKTNPQDERQNPVPTPRHRQAAISPKENHRPGSNNAASDIADAFDKQRDEAKRAIAIWRNQLDEAVQDSGSFWSVLGATAAATALSVTELSMDQASSLFGITRLGEGVAKGSFSGVMEDVDRLISVLPQGRAVKALSMASDVYEVGKTVASGGDLTSVAVTVAGAAMGTKSKKKSRQQQGDSTLRVQSARTLSKATRAKYIKRVQELHKALDLRGQSGKTTAILIARDPKTGTLKTLVSSSMERVPKKVRDKMKPNEYEVRGTKKSKNSSPNDHAHHAEVNGLSAILSNGWEVVEILPSRNACPLCAQMRKTLGVRITNPK